MSKLLHMPEILANTTHATINKWLINVGDSISKGQVIAEVETEKAVIELVAEEDALISQLLIAEGIEVEVGTAIAQLNGDGKVDAAVEQAPLSKDHGAEAPKSDQTAAQDNSSSVPQRSAPEPAVEQEVDQAHSERIFASPLAKRLAKQNQLDLTLLSGSGPKGRIVKRDIEYALEHSAASGATQQLSNHPESLSHLAQPASAATTTQLSHAYEEIPLSSMRKTIARRLAESKATVPHFYLNVECKVDALLELRTQINAVADQKISVNDLVIKAVALALKKVPEMNARWAETAIHQYHEVDISIAVATEKGLFTPVLKQVDIKSLSSINHEVAELAELARQSKLTPDQYQGGNFSISNLGMYGVSDFNAIINPPQSGILAVGAIQKKPIIVHDAIQIGSVMRCSLSADHRIVDGAVAAQWLGIFQAFIEDPLKLLI